MDAEGRELLAGRSRPRRTSRPGGVPGPAGTREYKTAQELFYAGLKLEQFGNTNFDYMKY
jgi:hypothetical protein